MSRHRALLDEALGMCTPGWTLLAHAKGPFKSCILTAERCLVHDFLAMKTIIRRHVGRRKAKPLHSPFTLSLFLFLFTVMSLLVFQGRTRRKKNRTQAHDELALGRLPKCEILESIGGRCYRPHVSCSQLLACLVEKVPMV